MVPLNRIEAYNTFSLRVGQSPSLNKKYDLLDVRKGFISPIVLSKVSNVGTLMFKRKG